MTQEPNPPADHELVWEKAESFEKTGELHARSAHRVAPEADYAVYSLCPPAPVPSDTVWDLELFQVKRLPTGDEVINEVDLGLHADEAAGKRCAEHWERHGTAPDGVDLDSD